MDDRALWDAPGTGGHRPAAPEHATTLASIEVGVCELHTIPTDRFPDSGTPPPEIARSCIAGDDW